ncbi:24485_t:CDS:2, partial [Gigaspora rosea]
MVYGIEICENQADHIHVAAIDPGVRTFLTWYSPTVGHGNIVPPRKRNSMKRAQARLRKQIQNLIDEVHKKSALWLACTFDIIVLSVF